MDTRVVANTVTGAVVVVETHLVEVLQSHPQASAHTVLAKISRLEPGVFSGKTALERAMCPYTLTREGKLYLQHSRIGLLVEGLHLLVLLLHALGGVENGVDLLGIDGLSCSRGRGIRKTYPPSDRTTAYE